MKIIGLIAASGSGKDEVARIIRDEVPATNCVAFAEPVKRFCRDVFMFSHEQLWGSSAARNAPDTTYGAKSKRPWDLFWAWLARIESGDAEWEDAKRRFARYSREFVEQMIGTDATEVEHAQATLNLIEWFYDVLGQRVLTPRYALQTLTDWGHGVDPNLWVNHGLDTLAAYRAFGATNVAVVTDVRFPNAARALRELGAELWKVERSGIDRSAVQRAGVRRHHSEDVDSDILTSLVTKTIYNDTSLLALRQKVREALKERGIA